MNKPSPKQNTTQHYGTNNINKAFLMDENLDVGQLKILFPKLT